MNYEEEERCYNISSWWKFIDKFSVKQAALLIVGVEPNSEIGVYCDDWKPHEKPDGYNIVLQAISDALIGGEIQGNITPNYDYDINGDECGEVEGSVNIDKSNINRDSLILWLKKRGHETGFFFIGKLSSTPNYLNKHHKRFSPKLAAAIMAWEAMEDENLLKGKTPKTAMEQWLEINYLKLKLSHKRGSSKNGYKIGDMNNSAVREAAKVANWDDGGPPKTPGQS
jgi:hypothetical protein